MFDGWGLMYVVHDTSLNTYYITSLLDFNHRGTAENEVGTSYLLIFLYLEKYVC